MDTAAGNDPGAENHDAAVERDARAEHRWPAVVALAVALILYALLPSDILSVPLRFTMVGLAIVMLVPVVLLNPHRLRRQTTWSRWLSVGQAVVLVVANQVALVQLIFLLISSGTKDGPSLLVAAVQVWVTNVIAFALVYWEIDRGGPVTRRHDARTELPSADYRFAQDEDHDAIDEVAARSSARIDWTPSFVDYLYESATNSMAFSPGAAMPLSPRIKGLMLVQAFGGFVMLALVIAHAVGQLGG
ncbi:hypothetical protein FB562_0966 [Homoserinimonas aerilata]|uniref:DUF1345 domain-containing protein n=1 Tax=Homoserinimonas aerilata TaxID=1162970 RepID=A0A542YIJ0_9MICO|nr:hypothetical protein [Homoserinimonas aerilata]TQL47893.1 hypothetical protein FB562_0966 [Homoserinimonas aerilata]